MTVQQGQRPYTAGSRRPRSHRSAAKTSPSPSQRPYTSPGKRPGSSPSAQPLIQIFQNKLESQRTKCDFLEAKIKKTDQALSRLKREILDERKFRKRLGGAKACNMLNSSIDKRMQYLENRLNKLTNRECGTHASNRLSMVDVDELRRKSASLKAMNTKLQKSFREKQRQMATIMDTSNELYKSRAKALADLKEMRERIEGHRQAHEKEWQELGETIQSSAAVGNYVKTSALKRKQKQIQEKLVRGELDPEEEAKLKAKLARVASKVARTEAEVKTSAETIETAEEAFKKVHAVAKTSSLSEVVDGFVRREDENFALFSFIQHVTQKIDALEQSLKREEELMEKYKKEQGDSDSSRRRLLFQMESKLKKLTSMGDEALAARQSAEDKFATLAEVDRSLFIRIECPSNGGHGGLSEGDGQREGKQQQLRRRFSSKPTMRNVHIVRPRKETERVDASIAYQLGHSVTRENLMLYLGTAEQKISDIMNVYAQAAGVRRRSRTGAARCRRCLQSI